MKRSAGALGWLAGLLLCAAPILPAEAAIATATAPPDTCRLPGLSHAVQCGVVQRPLDPARPDATPIDIHYVGFDKPRLAIVALLGEARQGCPVLVMGEESLAVFKPCPDITIGESLGQAFISRDIEICRYLAHRYGVGLPHP